ncbi:hypothetical protein E3N88_46245 [Mikania micrantha]|uniref:Retrotransposon gag domain-containing protein n=1 Tax=Mikania micrantha TaxID=192012 RepID=A0A5N6L6R8_9ASTR|nr:hypothetical protein E3N88_46245 [Mikania micrantha]
MELRQQGTIKDYCDSFEVLFNKSNIDEGYAIYLFLDGLKIELRDLFMQWHQHKLQSLKDAFSLALKLNSNKLKDTLSPDDPNSSLYIKVESHQVFDEMSKKVVFGKEIGSLNHELSIQESFDKNDSNNDKKNKGVTEYVGNGTNLDMDEYDNRYNIQEPNILPHDTDLSRWVVTHKNDNVNDVLNHAKKTSITTNDQVKFGKNIGILGLTKDLDMGKRKKQLSWLDTGWICNMEGKYAERDDTTQLRNISSIKGHDLSSVVMIQEATAKWNLIELNQKQANQKDEIDLSDQGVTTNQEIEFLNFNRKIGVTRLHDSSDRIEILKFNEKSVVTGLPDAIENGDIWLSKKYGEKFKDLGQDYEMWVVDFQELTSQVHENSHNLVVIGVAFQDSNSKNFGHSSKAMKFKY